MELDFGESAEVVVATVVADDIELNVAGLEWAEFIEALAGIGGDAIGLGEVGDSGDG